MSNQALRKAGPTGLYVANYSLRLSGKFTATTWFLTPDLERLMLRNRKGFTLIELLIVVVIIGILAAIAIPKFASTKEKAYVTAMKSDLRNMMTAQEAYFSDYTTYAASTGALKGFSQTTGVTITSISKDDAGWQATSSHKSLKAGQTCTIAVGSKVVDPLREGEPNCKT
jgi:prepilin-type N-terminal cleavage/methylation domain-containing protein